ncbi:hypothetical protein A2W39_00335 [Candidatus Azambacteria bacterium RIFCSPHIGHO2_01_46_10]|uniref:Glycosyl transferase family 1 domain-containing protein n=3 Tax=Candidatus Azamiibacteriota TaxID=1752741 RepID=A0A1F5C923_9BACT|nr:MAG: hypothetical protein A2W60_02535 [Candidatus Azambacteria bacterium RIFCSPHIGHO2_02_46_12]OGD35588.1 MAG: hypothetical protein A2W39_00335 [Candidatus Azambacteria bacterium RIFCSPHIGHO2_01_46_10]OGD39365.1 MAG: hypothetical protein A3A25_02975 [Candidatus Azambacteria bacterium RIFCSPLOWO2_01_FULL_46_26]
MTIGIDAHNLEIGRGGAAHRYLFNLLKVWNDVSTAPQVKFILYFKKEIPKELDFLAEEKFVKKILTAPFGFQSNALFVHWLLSRAAKKDKADILFSPYYVLPVFYGGKTAVTLHDIFYEVNPKAFSWPSWADKILLKRVSKISAKKASVIFAPSEFTKSEVVKYYKVSPQKVFVTHLGVEEKFKKPSIFDRQKIKEKYGIKNKFIFYIGSIFNRRRAEEAMNAFSQIAEKLPDYQFLVIGKNSTRPFIDVKKIALGINALARAPLIIYQETVSEEDLVVLYQAADLFIWLSDYEGFGLQVIEAQASSVPVVTTRQGSLKEIAGEAAIFVENPASVSEIASAIYSGLTDEILRKNLIESGLQNVKRFDWEQCAAETLARLRF